MSLRAPLICLLHCLLALLFVVPLACAAVAEKTLPDPAAYAAAPCPPSTAAYGNSSIGANTGTGPSIEDVWMQHGGARNYYSAQYSARQQYTGGATRIDPACLPLLPPMKAWGAPATKKVTKVSKSRKAAPAANPCPEVDKATGAAVSKSAPQVDSKAASQADKTDAATKTSAAASPRGANGQGSPASATPLKVSPPAADAVKAATVEKTPIH